ncbi:MAG: alkaline phosphatase D family protein [Planctomycetota bacterium]
MPAIRLFFRLHFLVFVLSFDAAAEIGPVHPQVIDTIAFGSCAREDREQPIWDSIVAAAPDLFVFLGDNVYVDIPTPPQSAGEFAAAYRALGAKPGYQRLKARCPILATWDDHDFGLNDAGKEFRLKRQSQTLLLSFFEDPPDSPRWTREGVYGAWMFGPPGKRVQVILLDTRYFRDPITPNVNWRPGDVIGPYKPPAGKPGGTILGEQQWAWLGAQLQRQADLRLIGSSIQVVAGEHGWECWAHFPGEQRRLVRMISNTNAGGVVFLSGDRHMIEISKYDDPPAPYPLWDFTSSGFNWGHAEDPVEPNRHRVGPAKREPNFGVIKIDWDAGALSLEGRNGAGEPLMRQAVDLESLAIAGGD